MLALLLTFGGNGLIGQAGSIEFTRTSKAYSFFKGKISSHVERNLKRLFLVTSSTYSQVKEGGKVYLTSIYFQKTLDQILGFLTIEEH